MPTRDSNAELRYSRLEPGFDGGLIHNDFVQAGLFIKTSEAQKLLIGKDYRSLTGETTTLCMVTGGVTTVIYKLINNPETETTQESDWEVTDFTPPSIAPVGEFDVATGFIVGGAILLTDDDHAVGNNGEFYVVTGAPAGHTETYAGLARGLEITVFDGDYLLSVGEYFAVLSPNSTWDTIGVPQSVLDYVAGTVIGHNQDISTINDLVTQLAAKYSVSDVASDLDDYTNNADPDLANVAFMDTYFHRRYDGVVSKTISAYSAAEIDSLLTGLGGGGGDMVLDAMQVVTALKTFEDGTFGLRNVADDFTSVFTNTNTAARTYILPNISGLLLINGVNTLTEDLYLDGANSQSIFIGDNSPIVDFEIYAVDTIRIVSSESLDIIANSNSTSVLRIANEGGGGILIENANTGFGGELNIYQYRDYDLNIETFGTGNLYLQSAENVVFIANLEGQFHSNGLSVFTTGTGDDRGTNLVTSNYSNTSIAGVAPGSYGTSAIGTTYINDASGIPTTNPTTGGGSLYSEAGVLKWRSVASGVVDLTVGGASQLSDLSDVVSATNTNRFALMANGSSGYVGRALVEADISNLGTYDNYVSFNLKVGGVQKIAVVSAGTLDIVGGADISATYSAGGVVTLAYTGAGGGGALSDLSDVVSATNTNRFALMANGSTGYVGRALVEADISNLGTYSIDIHGNITALNNVSGVNTGDQNLNNQSPETTIAYTTALLDKDTTKIFTHVDAKTATLNSAGDGGGALSAGYQVSFLNNSVTDIAVVLGGSDTKVQGGSIANVTPGNYFYGELIGATLWSISSASAAGGAAQLSDLSDVVSATNTNRFALMANGSSGYVGRALVEADISDFGTYDNYASFNLKTDGTQRIAIVSGGALDIVGGADISATYSAGGVVTLAYTGSPASQLSDLSDVVSATNTNRFALMANGSSGYVGRALVEADISDFGTYDNYASFNLKVGGVQKTTIVSGGDVDIVGGADISATYSAGGVVTLAYTGGGGIGGSITDNQIAIGATTANDIEGTPDFTATVVANGVSVGLNASKMVLESSDNLTSISIFEKTTANRSVWITNDNGNQGSIYLYTSGGAPKIRLTTGSSSSYINTGQPIGLNTGGPSSFANVTIGGTLGVRIPSGTDAQRGGTPSVGDLRWNTTGSNYEGYNGTTWDNLSVGGGASQLSDLSDVVSATNTNRFALMADGSSGYVGRALVEADISNLGTYDNYASFNLKVGGVQKIAVVSAGTLDIVGGTDISAVYSAGGVVTLNYDGIADDAVTYAKIQNVVADQRILGNISGAGGIVAELTAAQVWTMIEKELVQEQYFAGGADADDLAISTAVITFTMPNYATTLVGVSVDVVTAPTGSIATFDLNEAGVSVLSTKITIDVTEKTSETATTAPVISDSAIAANAIITLDIDGIGSTIAGAGAKCRIYYKKA